MTGLGYGSSRDGRARSRSRRCVISVSVCTDSSEYSKAGQSRAVLAEAIFFAMSYAPLWVLCTAIPMGNACSSAADCSHNGACVLEVCVCTAGWIGTTCSVLDVAPVDKGKWGYMPIPDGFSSWGGAVLKENGKYHMWVSENAKKCGMASWGTNSRCIHTESTSPEGPYAKTGVVFGPMCHEPKVIKAPTGEAVMYFTGIYDGVSDVGADGTGGFSSDHSYTTQTEFLCDCSTGVTTVSGSVAPLFSACANTASSDPTWMSWTSTPWDDRSWSKPVMIIDPRNETSATGFADAAFAGDTIDTNFAPVEIKADGSLLALWRSWQDCPVGGNTFCSVIHTASATHWKCDSTADCKSKYTFQTRNVFADEISGPANWGANEFFVSKGIEDPFGWKDYQGVYHALFHYMVSDRDLTSHAWSTDFFGEWTHTGDANLQNVSFTDGTFAKFDSCERPNLVMDDGKPVAFATACNAGTNPPEGYMTEIFPILRSTDWAVDNAAFTLVQPLFDRSLSTSRAGDVGTSYSSSEEVKTGPRLEKDEVQHFRWAKGMSMNDRYDVLNLLGDGTFGRVLLAEDCKKKRRVAIKVIRNVPKYTRNAQREAEILKDLRKAEADKCGNVRLHETFFHEEDGERLFCIVCEALGMSLYDLLKKNRYRGLWVQDIQSVTRQSLKALDFLHSEMNLTHTDLKLENVLFRSAQPPQPSPFPREAAQASKSRVEAEYVRPVSTEIKLIDFGNATYELEHHSTIINTRQYRAPEVILSLGWNELSDLWSLGCIVMEIYTGELVFRTHESLEHLAMMERILDRFPASMLAKAGERPDGRFVAKEKTKWQLRTPAGESGVKVKRQKPLKSLVQEEHQSVSSFCSKLLVLDPARRPSAAEALKHTFLSEYFPD